jgi:hypothetical protein
MLNTMDSAPVTIATPPGPTAGAGAAAGARAVALVAAALSALAMLVMSGFVLSAGEAAASLILPFYIGIVAFAVLLVALPVASVLGAVLARCNAVAAALVVAPLAGFLVPFGLFQDPAFAVGCGAISVLVGIIFATDGCF